jgi:hypothetical protein
MLNTFVLHLFIFIFNSILKLYYMENHNLLFDMLINLNFILTMVYLRYILLLCVY